MRKYIILMLATMVLSAGVLEAKLMPSYEKRGYDELKFNASTYGGYNFTSHVPTYGGIFAMELFCLRADLDLGGTTVNHPLCGRHFLTFGPSVGLSVGENHKVYVMYGFQTYAYIGTTDVTECKTDLFDTDLIYKKLKIGYQCTVWKRMFVSIEVSHLFKYHQAGYVYFPCSNANIGIGWKF